MSLTITDDCTSCDACVPVCPNTAITAGDVIYHIDADRCSECVGAEDSPQCQLVCPADCIVVGVAETPEQLQAKYTALHG
ncbi:MAG: YfhL family 4Fe-4S dicluster ferredoxin [Solirubrobacterales bacterium]